VVETSDALLPKPVCGEFMILAEQDDGGQTSLLSLDG
jgi:hypothetical protein